MPPGSMTWFFVVVFVFSSPRWAAGNNRPSASSTRYGPAMAASCSQWMTHSTSPWPPWRRDLLSLWSQRTPSAALASETQSPAGPSSTVRTGDSPRSSWFSFLFPQRYSGSGPSSSALRLGDLGDASVSQEGTSRSFSCCLSFISWESLTVVPNLSKPARSPQPSA